MASLAERLINMYGLTTILEANGITEADVIRILIDKGLVDAHMDYDNPRRLFYGDDYE